MAGGSGSGESCRVSPPPGLGWTALGSLDVGAGSSRALHGPPSVPGRTAAIRGFGLVSAVAFRENDQPSKPPGTKSRFLTPHWLYFQAQLLPACQYDQYPAAGGVSMHASR
ncbi:hypothetical protein AB0M95_39830 [Sphaerisporangium sp. NPDC051017]|uniref:hypothetical protein n=1 Tax=Sphaerisporangium sp. NPDC051017 TaxID=3154636 RepID=UPI0034198ADA